ncbi:uncharacterized protein EV154DRAFT_491171, partial [Mucor mucedo]|uniref:uncharacterized protein n=1 Tax=Mucor mucedo TaxID=29922 RepID=UPI00221ECF46
MSSSADYLLDLTQDDITALAENVDPYGDSQSEDELPDSSVCAVKHTMEKDQALRSMPTMNSAAKVVKHVDQTSITIAEHKSKQGILLKDNTVYESSFYCQATCHQYMSYELLSSFQHEPFDLNKLDIVLDPNSVLSIRITCTLNGLNTLKYPSWIEISLNKLMESTDFIKLQSFCKGDLFQYKIDKAFASSPLSYLLQKKAPHGVLKSLHIHLDWITKDSVMFQLAWNHDFKIESISNYFQEVLSGILTKRIFRHYPLIFSGAFVKRIVPVISHLPQIAQSLQKIIKTSKDTCQNNGFNDSLTDKLKMVEKNMGVLRPHTSSVVDQDEENKEALLTNLILGLYYTTTKSAKDDQIKSIPKTLVVKTRNTPDAVEAVTKIWSVTTLNNPSSLID